MSQRVALFLATLFFSTSQAAAVSITIIEDASYSMDTRWQTVAGDLGFASTILPRAALSDDSFFATTDVLVVSAGLVGLSAADVGTIADFLTLGGGVYLQSEYEIRDTNAAFESVVASLGGSFSWSGIIAGALEPMIVSGIWASAPNLVPSINDFWYGQRGFGDATIEPFLSLGGDDFGFVFTPPNASYGQLITTSDQDWIRDFAPGSADLMENILVNLAVPEPGTGLLMVGGLLSLATRRR